MTRREHELIAHAEDAMHELVRELEERSANKRLLKRIDTIVGKLYELHYSDD